MENSHARDCARLLRLREDALQSYAYTHVYEQTHAEDAQEARQRPCAHHSDIMSTHLLPFELSWHTGGEGYPNRIRWYRMGVIKIVDSGIGRSERSKDVMAAMFHRQ